MIIGICGLIGSGKDTVADFLVDNYNFTRESFASSLKDACSAVFGWDRELLEGRTPEARRWREGVDLWWACRLGIPKLTPRWVLQNWGTEVLRQGFHDDIWIASLEHKIANTNTNVVITDCRFTNEINSIRNNGGLIVRIKRGPEPDWFEDAKFHPQIMSVKHPTVHASEYSWAPTTFDAVIENNSTIDNLYKQVKNLVEGHLAST